MRKLLKLCLVLLSGLVTTSLIFPHSVKAKKHVSCNISVNSYVDGKKVSDKGVYLADLKFKITFQGIQDGRPYEIKFNRVGSDLTLEKKIKSEGGKLSVPLLERKPWKDPKFEHFSAIIPGKHELFVKDGDVEVCRGNYTIYEPIILCDSSGSYYKAMGYNPEEKPQPGYAYTYEIIFKNPLIKRLQSQVPGTFTVNAKDAKESKITKVEGDQIKAQVKFGSTGEKPITLWFFRSDTSQKPTFNICSFQIPISSEPPTQATQSFKESAVSVPPELIEAFGIKRFECNGGRGYQTALGCIPIGNTKAFVNKFLQITIGIAGVISFLVMLWGSFLIMSSAGNPEKVQQGKEFITSAIGGLLLIIFSLVLLKLIGIDILGLPGFKV